MNSEEYRKCIREMVGQIEGEDSLKKIFNKVHNIFVREDCIKKREVRQIEK